MFSKQFLIAFASLPFLMTSCSSDSDSDSSKIIEILTVSGDTISLTGVWKTECYSKNGGDGPDAQETLTFTNEGKVEYENEEFVSTDASCGGSGILESGYKAKVKQIGTQAITSWQDGSGDPADAPQAQDEAALSDTESFTSLRYTFEELEGISGVDEGDSIQFGYIADDTGSDLILYRVENNDPNPSYGTTVDFFIKE